MSHITAQFSDLKEKRILITGATRGIGLNLAKNLATQGAYLLFNYRQGSEEKAEKVKAELMELGASGAEALLFDITNSPQMKESVDKAAQDFGPITGLVNNAGIARDQLMLRLKPEDLELTIQTNLNAAILLTQFLTRQFMRGENVSIVNMSSIVGLMGNASQVAYAASKAGLIGFTKSYAKELASRNIRCNAVCPGFIATEMTDSLDERVKEQYLSGIPLKRFGEANEVGNLVSFLLSNASSYITGEVIKIDGGLYI